MLFDNYFEEDSKPCDNDMWASAAIPRAEMGFFCETDNKKGSKEPLEQIANDYRQSGKRSAIETTFILSLLTLLPFILSPFAASPPCKEC